MRPRRRVFHLDADQRVGDLSDIYVKATAQAVCAGQ
jgi:hypothetical protein